MLFYITGVLTTGFGGLDFIMKLVLSMIDSMSAQAFPAPERDGLIGYYNKHLREFVEGRLADALKGIMVLVSVVIFEAFSRWVQLMGFPREQAATFETIDSAIAVSVVVVVCGFIVLRVVRSFLVRGGDADVR